MPAPPPCAAASSCFFFSIAASRAFSSAVSFEQQLRGPRRACPGPWPWSSCSVVLRGSVSDSRLSVASAALLGGRGLLGDVVVDGAPSGGPSAGSSAGSGRSSPAGCRRAAGSRCRASRPPVRYWAAAKEPSSSRAVVELLGALGDVVEQRVDAARAASAVFSLAALYLLGGRTRPGGRGRRPSSATSSMLRPGLRPGRGVRGLGEQGHGGEGGRGEGRGPYACDARTRGTRLAVRRQGRRLLPWSAYRVSCRVRAGGSEGCPTVLAPRGGRTDSPQVSVGPRLRAALRAHRTRRRPPGPARFAGRGRTACLASTLANSCGPL